MDDVLYQERSFEFTDPMAGFGEWFSRAQAEETEPLAMSLATVALQEGALCPDVRVVYLKKWDAVKGFGFFTNRMSRKGRQMEEHPHVALGFFWAKAMRQVRIQGEISLMKRKDVEAYFATRPRMSRLGAHASLQSSTMESRHAFAARIAEMEAKFPGESIPCPQDWVGYLVLPRRMEFWQGQTFRLHDREVFTRAEDGSWSSMLLYP